MRFKIYSVIFILSISCLVSCNKDIFDKSYAGYEGIISMPQAVDGRYNFDLQLVDEPFTLPFGASYGGLQLPGADIPVEFALKDDWIGRYNDLHGTNYKSLPAGSYTISGLKSVIKKGETSSQPLEISIESRNLDRETRYMFPITLVSAASTKIDSALQTVWFKIDNIIRKETDVTGNASISVSDDNDNPNENSSKIVDGNIDTKFLTFNYSPNFWMQLKFSSPEVVGAYTLTSGNDAHDRDPKTWTLVGSDNGTDWVELDAQSNIVFSNYQETQRYEFENETAYTYYRINITERFGGGNGLFQLSEWRLISFQ